MSTTQFHRRFKTSEPIAHFCEQWHVHLFNAEGDAETYRVTFKLNKFERPSFEVAFENPTGAFINLNKKNHYKRIKRVIETLRDEFEDYKQNRNYQIKIK